MNGGRNAASGSFSMKGFFKSADWTLQLTPVSWISQPAGYVMVALSGVVSGYTYRGGVDGYRCSEFSVTRQTTRLGATSNPANTAKMAIPLRVEGGTFTVPVSINDKLTLDFVLDSGAADVSIPADVVLTLVRTGTLNAADFIGNRTYKLANGSTTPSQVFRIRTLRVGEKVIQNVIGSVAPVEGSLLLGQSFLSRFKSWSIDNQRQVLLLE